MKTWIPTTLRSAKNYIRPTCSSGNSFQAWFFLGGAVLTLLLHGLFSVAESRQGLLSSCSAQASYCSGFSCCRAQAQQLWCNGLSVPLHVGSSLTSDGTHVYSTGRWILNHWATRKSCKIHFEERMCPIVSEDLEKFLSKFPSLPQRRLKHIRACLKHITSLEILLFWNCSQAPHCNSQYILLKHP